MLPCQSLIWAVIRKEDSTQRLYYSMTSTFLGRMCLSGDINELSETQWAVIEECRAFYEECKLLIKKGQTKILRDEILSYRQPNGCQVVYRFNENKALLVIHNFDQTVVELPFEIGEITRSCGIEAQMIVVKKMLNKCRIEFPQHSMGCALLVDLG